MDLFPQKCFPIKYQKEKTQRQIFQGLGSNKNIDVADVRERKFHSQHVPFESKTYSASRPALPLHLSPMKVPYPFEDRVTKEIKTHYHEVSAFCNKLKTMRGVLIKPQNIRVQGAFSSVLEQLKSEKSKAIGVPGRLDDLVKQYEKVKDIHQVMTYNSTYTGGCLASVGNQANGGNQLLICPADHNFKTTALFELSTSPEVKVTLKNSINVDYEIQQLQSKSCKNLDFCVARGGSLCELFSLPESAEGVSSTLSSVAKEHFKDEFPTSVDLSGYIPGECAVATDKGNIYLWSPAQSKQLVRQNMETRFPSHQAWRQAVFGSSPRHIIMADCTAVQMFDIRGQYDSSIDLFALPSKFLHPAERLCLVEKHPFSHHAYLVATDQSLLLVDDRFPGNPMLQWNHMLRNFPQLTSSVVMETDSVLVAMGSLSPAEVCAYQYRYGLSASPQSIGSPWKFSQIGDFTEWPDLCNPLHKFAADLRFNVSLTGISVVRTSTGFVLLQLDSLGELYFQEFKSSNEMKDLTFCAGPMSGDLMMDNSTTERGKRWTEDLHRYVDSCKKATKNVNVSDFFSDITLSKPGHVSCSLCMVDTCGLNLSLHKQALCYSCLHEVNVARKIADLQHNNIVQLEDSVEPDSEEDDGKDYDTLSQILLHQWNKEEDDEDYEENFKQLLLKRDEEIKEKRKLTKKESSKSSVQRHSTQMGDSTTLPVDRAPVWVTGNKELDDLIARQAHESQSDVEENTKAHDSFPVMSKYREEEEDSGVNRTVENDSMSSIENNTEHTHSNIKDERTNSGDEQESNTSDVFLSQVERDYPFMAVPSQLKRKNSLTSDHVSNLSSISFRSDGFLPTPPRMLSFHSPRKDKRSVRSGNETLPGGTRRDMMCSSPQLHPTPSKRRRHSSISSSCSKRSVKSNSSVQSDGFRSTPSRMHQSPIQGSKFISPGRSSLSSSLSDWNCSMDLFDSSLNTFDLLQNPMLGSQKSQEPSTQSQPDIQKSQGPNTQSQPGSQRKTKAKKQLMTGF
ncbi:uncharacterized protein LOC133181673 [Saccostrea echinata]|uniref:uncharacterized protein LOC133181673 n=1 Tax=Saccostrea echinata TaxID=191078 RepID=UPI002A7FAA0E|nr:uncharacterized protein LOC133181673 [Saccostrea echinata]